MEPIIYLGIDVAGQKNTWVTCLKARGNTLELTENKLDTLVHVVEVAKQ